MFNGFILINQVGELQKAFDEEKADPSRNFDVIFEEIEIMRSKLQELYDKERQVCPH